MNSKDIGFRIKKLRQNQRITIDKLATMTGFTKGYISRIENSFKPPPLFTLNTIAQALGVDITFLLSDTEDLEETDIIIVHKEERKRVSRGKNTYPHTYESLAYKKAGKNMEPYLITVGFTKDEEGYCHQGEEFIFVIEGEMDFFYGDKNFRVVKGDSLYFDASIPHVGVSLADKEAKLLCVVYSYKRL